MLLLCVCKWGFTWRVTASRSADRRRSLRSACSKLARSPSSAPSRSLKPAASSAAWLAARCHRCSSCCAPPLAARCCRASASSRATSASAACVRAREGTPFSVVVWRRPSRSWAQSSSLSLFPTRRRTLSLLAVMSLGLAPSRRAPPRVAPVAARPPPARRTAALAPARRCRGGSLAARRRGTRSWRGRRSRRRRCSGARAAARAPVGEDWVKVGRLGVS